MSVVLLERQPEHRDIVRGEYLAPWGVAEAAALGLDDCLAAAGAWTLRWCRFYDELYRPDDAPLFDLSETWTAGVEGPLAFSHPALCAALTGRARAAGVDVRMGVRDVRLLDGAGGVRVAGRDGEEELLRAPLVVGASGRYGRIGAEAGIQTKLERVTYGGGLAVDGLDAWPADTMAMGAEGDVQYFVIPRGGGTARLYLAYDEPTHSRFTGRHGQANFLEAFRMRCLPDGGLVAAARPIGRFSCFRGGTSSVERPVAELDNGLVVVVGDEGGVVDTVLGVGVANALRDARLLAERLATPRDRWPAELAGFTAERWERMRRLHLCGELMAAVYVHFGEEGRARRRRALDLIAHNRSHAIYMLVAAAGPEWLPDCAFAEYLFERLVAP